MHGGRPRVTTLPVVDQTEISMWSISEAIGTGSVGSEGEIVCAILAVDGL